MDIEEKADFSSRFQCAPLIRLLENLVNSIKQPSAGKFPRHSGESHSVVLDDCLCYTKPMAILSPESGPQPAV